MQNHGAISTRNTAKVHGKEATNARHHWPVILVGSHGDEGIMTYQKDPKALNLTISFWEKS